MMLYKPEIPILAGIVTFKPNLDVVKNIVHISRCFSGEIVVVDNTPACEASFSLAETLAALGCDIDRTKVVYNGNLNGIAGALNIICRLAEREGCIWAVTFDQDSRIDDEYFTNLDSFLKRTQSDVAAVGPCLQLASNRPVRYLSLPTRFSFRWTLQDEAKDSEHLVLISSGMAIRLADWRRVGGFDEWLFIDHVDTDMCLKWLSARKKIVLCTECKLFHALGYAKEVKVGGMSIWPKHYTAARLYYQYRNRLYLFVRWLFQFPGWVVFESIAAGWQCARIVMFEVGRIEKLAAILRGTSACVAVLARRAIGWRTP